MIIVQVAGGLGNQLFQYAMGRSLAIENNMDFKIDTSFFKTDKLRTYRLSHFAVKEIIASETECHKLKQKHSSFINRVLRKTIRKGNYVIYEKNLLFSDFCKKITSPVYLAGYWQSEKYFEIHSERIREEFHIMVQPSDANRRMLMRIASSNSISVHVRRGDFVSESIVNRIHGTCSMAYYENALNYIAERVNDPVFYIFSDDIAWAKNNLKGNHLIVFVDINDAGHDYEDLRLMYSCQHHIIANSTFSWWAAWLNPLPNKIVIAPTQWFADYEKNNESKDIIPSRWIRL